MRIPLCNNLACFYSVSFGNGDDSTIRQFVALALTTQIICHCDCTRSGNRDQFARLAFHCLQIVQTDCAAVLNLNVIHRSSTRCSTTNVEGAHGELSARLANRLSCDNTHSLTDIHKMPAREITSVTRSANAVGCFTGNRAAHHHFINAQFIKSPGRQATRGYRI